MARWVNSVLKFGEMFKEVWEVQSPLGKGEAGWKAVGLDPGRVRLLKMNVRRKKLKKFKKVVWKAWEVMEDVLKKVENFSE